MSGKVGIVLDRRFEDHHAGPGHPESAARLAAIRSGLAHSGIMQNLTILPPREADMRWIELVHQRSYIDRVLQACSKGYEYIGQADCGICPASYQVALLAVGGVLSAIDAVMAGSIDRAFCAVRPPGHHAEYHRAMGFCLFNNIAIAARYLQQHHKLEKIFILDWDVHHGNGTQHTFQADPTVFYCSLHQDPSTLYPGTGFAGERGLDAGQGFTLNLPMPAGAGSEQYRQAFQEAVLPAIDDFEAQFILISTGFDAHADDPLAMINLTEQDYYWFTQQVLRAADDHCSGRMVTVLEGGYNLQVLPGCTERHLQGLL